MNSITVLYVDDEPDLAATAAEFIEDIDDRITVETTSDVNTALEQLQANDPDCIVADYDMPQMDGLEFLRTVREDHPELPFILVTGKGDEELASEAITAGVTDYFQKTSGQEHYELLANRVRNAVDQVRAQRKRNREEARYQAFVKQSTDIISVLDRDGLFKYQSPSVERVLGFHPEEMIGENAIEYIHPDDRGEVLEVYEAAISDPDATPTAEFRFRHADGSWRWLESRGTNQLENPAVKGLVLNSRDITERKRREQELQNQNERLNEFAGIVSHDLRNPLEVAQIRLEFAQEECETEHHDVIERALHRMEAIISDVLTWAREGGEVQEVELVELADVVDRYWSNVETREASLNIKTQRSVEADASRLQQLFENLIRNAIEHGGEKVTVTVGDLEDGFFFEDDGPGIPHGEREQVFEVGYSTRDEGTGFGLNIVREIADAHGWDIDVTSGDAGGARFEFTGVQNG